MASQTTKILDVTRSFVPVDPNAFPETYHATDKEDSPESRKPIVFYEGFNFLPTSYGYKSYFGVSSTLDIDAIPSRVDRVMVIQTDTFENLAVALCEDGIWTKTTNASGAWTHAITLAIPAEGVHLDWTYCVISNELFCYRQSGAFIYRFSNRPQLPTAGEIEGALPTVIDPDVPHPKNVFYGYTPNFLNMEGQMGIFKAGSRLGIWDSANATGWSSLDDFADFTPAVKTLVSISIFQEVTGRIVNILSSGDGFVIYATKSIVYIGKSDSSTMLWNPKVLIKNAGIAFMRECCSGASDTDQFAYTPVGLVQIDKDELKVIVPEVTDHLKDSREPIYLTILQGRYLFLEILDSNYIDGLVTFTETTVGGGQFDFPTSNPEIIDDIYNGNTAWQLAEAERLRLLAELEAADEDGYTPRWLATINNKQVVQPLGEGAPVFRGMGIPYNDALEFAPFDEVISAIPIEYDNNRVPVGYDYDKSPPTSINLRLTTPFKHRVNSGSSTTVITPVVYEMYDTAQAVGIPDILEGEDLSEELDHSITENWTIDDFIAYQTGIWADRDAEVIALLAYVAIYESSTRIGSTQKALNSGFIAVDGGSGSLAPVNVDDTDTVEIGIGLEGVGPSYTASHPCFANIYETGDITYTFNSATSTVDSGWTPPLLAYENGVISLQRIRGFVTGVQPVVNLTQEEEVELTELTDVYEFDEILGFIYDRTESVTWKVSDTVAECSIQVAALTTDMLDNNPTQTGYLQLAGYDYMDINGNPQFLPYTPPPPTLSYIWNPVPPLLFPPSSFLLQDGSIGPVYPTIPGALVYDLQLKKWGKMKQDYKVLLDYSPINSNTGNIIPYENFGIDGGAVLTNAKIALFNKNPVDSYIKMGKIGYWRQGVTSSEEVHVHFRSPSTGKIAIETSIDGSIVELGLYQEVEFTSALKASMEPSVTGRWHNIVVHGNYDIKHMEFRGTIVGNR
jgi:hypothetical protein